MKCTHCGSDLIKKNGYTRHEKQNYRCLECGRQFSESSDAKIINEHTKELVRKALLEPVFTISKASEVVE
jgi:transposase-like protein